MRKLCAWGVSLLLALSVAVVSYGAPAAQAANVTDGFDPSYIVSDANFYNGNAMTAAQVQTFLNQRVPECTIGQTGRQPGTTKNKSVVAKECLKTAKFTTATKAADLYCQKYTGAAGETAAQIIAKVGKACGISQRTIIVMLDKEQSLVSDSWPTERQFTYAMGFACPDSGPGGTAQCEAERGGFFNQVYGAAHRLKEYLKHPEKFRYRAGVNNTVQWHPNKECGTSTFVIRNNATAGLYTYTPYRPNYAALQADRGTGDICSTYGNRNFYVLWKLYFGVPNPQSTPPMPTYPVPLPKPKPVAQPSIALGDVIARDAAGALWNYGPLGTKSNPRKKIGSGWGGMRQIVANDFNADGVQDLIASRADGTLWLYTGRAAGGFTAAKKIGTSGWANLEIRATKLKSSQKYPTILARFPNGQLRAYSWNGAAITGNRVIGSGWQAFKSVNWAYFDSDANTDAIAQRKDGKLVLYRTNGSGFVAETRRTVGQGWGNFRMVTVSGLGGSSAQGFVAVNGNKLLYYPMTRTGRFGVAKTIGSSGWSTYTIVSNTR